MASQYSAAQPAVKFSAPQHKSLLRFIQLAFASLLMLSGPRLVAEGVNLSVLDGVFTQAQAGRGKVAYKRYCADCHLANLQGDGLEPPLTGSLFLDAWREDYIASIYDFMQTRMPKSRKHEPGSLKENQYLDILSYILSENEFPTGDKDLAMEDLGKVMLTGHEGPMPLPPTALGRVAGCFNAEGSNYTLTDATAPSRVREADVTDEIEVAKSAMAAPGSLSFTLNNLEYVIPKDGGSVFAGKKVQAKGVINLESNPPRIHVLSLTDTGQRCGA